MFPLLLPLQILFILVDSNLKSNERVVSFFKLKKSQLPALAIFHTPDEEHDVLSLDEVSVQRVQDFCNRFLQRMQKVKGDSCTVCRKPGSCRMMRLLTKLLQKMILVPSATPYPCHLLFHFCLHLNIGKVLDLGQSRDECVCRTSLLIDLYLLIYSKTSLVSAAVWRSQWSIYFLGRASEDMEWRVLLDIENGCGDWWPVWENQRDSGMDRHEIYQEGHKTEYTVRTLPEVSAGRGTIQPLCSFSAKSCSVSKLIFLYHRGFVCPDPVLCNWNGIGRLWHRQQREEFKLICFRLSLCRETENLQNWFHVSNMF